MYRGENQLDLIHREVQGTYFHKAFAKVMDIKEGGQEGIGILSKHKIMNTKIINLAPKHDSIGGHRLGNRKLIHVTLDVRIPQNIGTIHVINTHFAIFDMEQCHTIVQVLSYIDSFNPKHPVFLVGDFNQYKAPPSLRPPILSLI
eukprot:TRINITY_DN32218_c0_g1_i1.p2 TRINITY_DN32218_c0_g1~~TRINITY_DN32218_c0_g1_i1.p2  ORF type:complete len:145 (+),score=37.47 TRINITY_DN32218_c0_g1_i1:204-638(+)